MEDQDAYLRASKTYSVGDCVHFLGVYYARGFGEEILPDKYMPVELPRSFTVVGVENPLDQRGQKITAVELGKANNAENHHLFYACEVVRLKVKIDLQELL